MTCEKLPCVGSVSKRDSRQSGGCARQWHPSTQLTVKTCCQQPPALASLASCHSGADGRAGRVYPPSRVYGHGLVRKAWDGGRKRSVLQNNVPSRTNTRDENIPLNFLQHHNRWRESGVVCEYSRRTNAFSWLMFCPAILLKLYNRFRWVRSSHKVREHLMRNVWVQNEIFELRLQTYENLSTVVEITSETLEIMRFRRKITRLGLHAIHCLREELNEILKRSQVHIFVGRKKTQELTV